MKEHAFEYQHEGHTWVIRIHAASEADGWQRICRMQDATYLGEVQGSVPASLGLFVRLYCGLRNLLRASGRSSA